MHPTILFFPAKSFACDGNDNHHDGHHDDDDVLDDDDDDDDDDAAAIVLSVLLLRWRWQRQWPRRWWLWQQLLCA